MILKILAGVVAVVLMLAYLLPPAIKLKDPMLAAVIGVGIVLMLIDLYQSLRQRD